MIKWCFDIQNQKRKDVSTFEEPVPDYQCPQTGQEARGVEHALPARVVQHQGPHPTCYQGSDGKKRHHILRPSRSALTLASYSSNVPKMAAAVHEAHEEASLPFDHSLWAEAGQRWEEDTCKSAYWSQYHIISVVGDGW